MIEKVLNEMSVTPKITLTQTEYNRLVELAQANARQIDERAVEYYKKNGVCGIHIDAYVREQNCGCDDIVDTFRFDCQPRYGYVQPSDEYQPNPFAIDSATRQRIMKFAASYATSAFYRKFGKQLMHINNALRYERRTHREWVMTRTLALTGWLLAVLMLIYVIQK